jgi:hypothetical protein
MRYASILFASCLAVQMAYAGSQTWIGLEFHQGVLTLLNDGHTEVLLTENNNIVGSLRCTESSIPSFFKPQSDESYAFNESKLHAYTSPWMTKEHCAKHLAAFTGVYKNPQAIFVSNDGVLSTPGVFSSNDQH